MLKLTGRICLILLAAGIIACGLYLIVNDSGSKTTFVGGEGQHLQNGTGPGGGRELGRGPHQDGDRGGSIFGMAGIATKLGLLAVITAVVIIIQKLVGRKPKPAEIIDA